MSVAAEARALAARLRRESRPGEVFEAARALDAAAAEIDALRAAMDAKVAAQVGGAREPRGERGPASSDAKAAA